MRRQKKNRMTKDTIPEGFSVKLALVDLIPVVFFGLSAVRVGSLFHSALFIAGAALCLVSGIVKVLWKGIVAVSGRNVWPLFVQMRVAMPVGFALLLAAVIAGRARLSGAAILAEVTGFPACIFFGLGVLGMALMTVFAFRLDSGDPRSNWLEQGVNGLAQLCFFHWPVPGVMCARAKAPRHRPRLEATEESTMPITVHIYYRGEHGAARRFAQEMLASSTAAAVLFAPSYVLLSYRNAK